MSTPGPLAHGKPVKNVLFLPVPAKLMNSIDVAALAEIVGNLDIDLLILDTQARVTVGAEENSSRDMGVFVDNLEQIRHARPRRPFAQAAGSAASSLPGGKIAAARGKTQVDAGTVDGSKSGAHLVKMSLYKVVLSARSSLWLIPVLCVLLGAMVSFATIALDRANDYELVPRSLVGGPDAALGILTTVATSMVSLTALVLTIVLVVVQLAMGQFSPRIVQRLLRDRPSQFAIGLFVATFVHTLLTIREVEPGDPGEPGQVPGVAVIVTFVLSLASIAVLVMYVHHVGQALRVSALVELAGDQTRKLLDRVYPELGPHDPDADDPAVVTAVKSGVLTTVAHGRLVEAARRADCTLELVPSLGEYVPAGGRLFTVHGDPDRLDRDKVNDAVIFSMERTLDQDVAYGLRLLVDMAERSLSDSSWQDPTTAVQAIDRLHDCLRQLARRPLPDGRHRDDDGAVRLVEHVMTWDAYVHLAFDEIRLAGAGSPQVARRLQAALRDLRSLAPEERRSVLDEELALLSAGTSDAFALEEDVKMALEADPEGIGGPRG